MALDILVFTAAFMVGVLIGAILLGLCAVQDKKLKESEDVVMGYKNYKQITKEEALARCVNEEVQVLVPGPDWEAYVPTSLNTLLNGVLYFAANAEDEEPEADDGPHYDQQMYGDSETAIACSNEAEEAVEGKPDTAMLTEKAAPEEAEELEASCEAAVHDAADNEPETEMPSAVEQGTRKRGKLDTGKTKALHDAGWSNIKIADEIGCSNQVVGYHLKKMLNEQ